MALASPLRDLAEHGIAPRGIVTRSSFACKAVDAVQEKARALASFAGPIPGASALEDLITPATVTVGVRLLRLMGWKEGQGLGPRVKRKAQRQHHEPAVRVYGCSLPGEGLQLPQECEGEDYLPEGLTFAPQGRGAHGLHGEGRPARTGLQWHRPSPGTVWSARLDPGTLVHTHPHPALSLLEQAPASGHTRPGITGQAFGVGALEEEDDDIYSRDSLSRLRLCAEGGGAGGRAVRLGLPQPPRHAGGAEVPVCSRETWAKRWRASPWERPPPSPKRRLSLVGRC
ncbi:G patch domain-containing protein 1-like [Rhinoraja longicauda]